MAQNDIAIAILDLQVDVARAAQEASRYDHQQENARTLHDVAKHLHEAWKAAKRLK